MEPDAQSDKQKQDDQNRNRDEMFKDMQKRIGGKRI